MGKLHIWSSLLLGLALLGVAFPATGSDEVTYKGSTTVLPIAVLLSEALAPNVDLLRAGRRVRHRDRGDHRRNGRYRGLLSLHEARGVREGRRQRSHALRLGGCHRRLGDCRPPIESDRADPYEDLRRIYFGEVTNWSALGGPDMPIVVVSRDTSSGTYGTFKEVVLENQEVTDGALFQSSNGAVATTVASTPGAIGYVGLGYLQPSLKALPLAKTAGGPFVAASVETALSLEYPLSRPLFMITNGYPQGAVARVIRFALSDEGQRLVLEAGYAPIRALSE